MAASYLEQVDIANAAYVTELSQTAFVRFKLLQHKKRNEGAAINKDAGEILMIEALTLDVLANVCNAVESGDVLLHLTSTCCRIDACDKLDYKQCVMEVLGERFAVFAF
jgi:hypothetical protein